MEVSFEIVELRVVENEVLDGLAVNLSIKSPLADIRQVSFFLFRGGSVAKGMDGAR